MGYCHKCTPRAEQIAYMSGLYLAWMCFMYLRLFYHATNNRLIITRRVLKWNWNDWSFFITFIFWDTKKRKKMPCRKIHKSKMLCSILKYFKKDWSILGTQFSTIWTIREVAAGTYSSYGQKSECCCSNNSFYSSNFKSLRENCKVFHSHVNFFFIKNSY